MRLGHLRSYQGLFAMNIHKRKASTALIVCIPVLLVVASLLVKSYFRQRELDPRVTMEFGEGAITPRASVRQAVISTMIDGEVARTAERIGEATALALSCSLYAASEQFSGGTPRSANDILSGLVSHNLLPPGLAITQFEGSLVSTYGSVSLRYRPAPLGIEVISIGHKPAYGPALIVRIPDEFSEKGEAKLYVASSLGAVRVPGPFAPAAEVIALGWSPETLRSLK